MSIGFQNPISGSGGMASAFVIDKNSSGGAIKGYMPQTIVKVDKDYKEYEQIRFTLKQSWNTTYPSQLNRSNKQAIITPFRAVNNAGDLLSREYYSCGGPCQSFQSRPGMFGLKNHFGHIQNNCDGSGVQPSSCNIKYVYDSSDYTRFMKQKAVNKNYNDASYGGDQSSASQSAWRHVRRY